MKYRSTTKMVERRKAFAWLVPGKEQGRRLYEDQGQNHNQLSTPGLNSGTESFITAAQDQRNKTNNYRKMVPTQCAEFAGNLEKQLTAFSRHALNLPRQNTYKDTTHLPHISTGQYASTMTSKKKINTTNMNQLQWQKTKHRLWYSGIY